MFRFEDALIIAPETEQGENLTYTAGLKWMFFYVFYLFGVKCTKLVLKININFAYV